jgi:eukaryotic-like serine/threonine-protein kinase
MEYIEGQALSARLQKGPLTTTELLQYSIQIANALDKAHKQGIVHRDLKPGNIMLTKSGIKLLDFGLAKLQPEEPKVPEVSSLPTEMQDLTREGTILGTIQYMAPEQLEGKNADARTDIFAFGCILYEMATGKKAFTGNSQASLITAIMSSEPPPISKLQPMSPPALDRVVKTCLAKDPEERWQNAHDLMNELKWIGESGSPTGTSLLATGRGKRPWVPWAMTAIALLLAAGVIARYQNHVVTYTGPIRSTIVLPEKSSLRAAALSPDGTTR